MSATVRGSSPIERIYSGSYPLAQRGVLIGYPYTGPQHTLGYWQSDNAVDISVPVGTDVVAVDSGFVHARGDWPYPFNLADAASGWQVPLFGADGANYFYSRLSQRFVSDGDYVAKGQVIGKSGGSGGVPHLHIAIQPFPANQAPNPSLEHDAIGVAPASWVNGGSVPAAVFQVRNAWSSQGANSLYVATQTMASGSAAIAIVDTGVSSGGAPQIFAVSAGSVVAVRADANVVAVAGSMKLATQVDWHNAAGGYLSSSFGAAQVGAIGAVTFSDVFTPPGSTALARVYWSASSTAPSSSMSYYLDGVLVAVLPSGSLVPGYSDNDQPLNPQVRWG